MHGLEWRPAKWVATAALLASGLCGALCAREARSPVGWAMLEGIRVRAGRRAAAGRAGQGQEPTGFAKVLRQGAAAADRTGHALLHTLLG